MQVALILVAEVSIEWIVEVMSVNQPTNRLCRIERFAPGAFEADQRATWGRAELGPESMEDIADEYGGGYIPFELAPAGFNEEAMKREIQDFKATVQTMELVDEDSDERRIIPRRKRVLLAQAKNRAIKRRRRCFRQEQRLRESRDSQAAARRREAEGRRLYEQRKRREEKQRVERALDQVSAYMMDHLRPGCKEGELEAVVNGAKSLAGEAGVKDAFEKELPGILEAWGKAEAVYDSWVVDGSTDEGKEVLGREARSLGCEKIFFMLVEKHNAGATSSDGDESEEMVPDDDGDNGGELHGADCNSGEKDNDGTDADASEEMVPHDDGDNGSGLDLADGNLESHGGEESGEPSDGMKEKGEEVASLLSSAANTAVAKGMKGTMKMVADDFAIQTGRKMSTDEMRSYMYHISGFIFRKSMEGNVVDE